MTSTIKKAIFPVAGFGTRFLPATKAQPKEMLPLVDKPIIQYLVEEAVAAGIKEIIFITSQTKRAIEDHFDRNFELEYLLTKKKKISALKEVSKISKLARFVYIRQPSPKGLGDAVLQAASLIGDEPFAVFLGDDVIDSPQPAISQLIDAYSKYQVPIIAVHKVKNKDVDKYGIIDGQKLAPRTYSVNKMVEKPKIGQAPSNLAVTGRYILTPQIFSYLKKISTKSSQELGLTDALKMVIKKEKLYAYEYQGDYFDCGNKLGYLKATVHYALKHDNLNKPFKQFLKQQTF